MPQQPEERMSISRKGQCNHWIFLQVKGWLHHIKENWPDFPESMRASTNSGDACEGNGGVLLATHLSNKKSK